jgi:hypothetical protein
MKKCIVSLMCACSIMAYSLCLAREDDLSGLAQKKRPLVVSLAGFADQSGQPGIDVAEFKKAFETALVKRGGGRSFRLAESPDAGDIQIAAVIKKYQYLEKDPITSYGGPALFLLDAATTENYADLEVEFTVTDARTNSVLWKNTVSTFIKRMMPRDKSIPLVYDKLSRTFLWKCFGRPR